MDAVSGLFLNALGTDMVTMEEYFPFITKAFDVMQYTAWAVLFLIVVWQLFRAFGGPITEAENPWQLVVRGAIFALLIGYAKPIFMLALDIARAPYTALMDVSMTAEEFTFAGVEQVLSNGLLTIVSTVTVVGPILVLILLIALGWNYFKLLLEAVERYIVVGVLCYTSPLAFCMGGSKATNQVFKSWCRMVGSQLLLLVMNVWFIRGFNSSVGQYRAGIYLSMAVLRTGIPKDRAEIRQLYGRYGTECGADRFQHGHGTADGRKGDQRRGTQRKERRQRVRQGRFDCNRNRRRGQRLCIRLCQQIQG